MSNVNTLANALILTITTSTTNTHTRTHAVGEASLGLDTDTTLHPYAQEKIPHIYPRDICVTLLF